MEVKKDSIFSPQSKRNLVVTASLAMALGMGVAPGIAFADEATTVEDTPIVACVETETHHLITRAQAAAPAEEAPAVAEAPVVEQSEETRHIIKRADADSLQAASTFNTPGYYGSTGSSSTSSTSSTSSSSSTIDWNNPGTYYVDPSDYIYDTIDEHPGVTEQQAATEELTDFISEAVSTTDFAEELGAESVTVVGSPVLETIAEGVFEVMKMPSLEVTKADGTTATDENFWWCVYIDGVKTKVMDAVSNLADGIDHFLWSPDGTVDPTTFEGNVVYAQDPGMTVVMTASSMLGVEAMSEPETLDTGDLQQVVPDVMVDTTTIEADTKDEVTETVEPDVSMSGRIASYIPTQVATTPAVEAAAETVETLAVTADHTNYTPAVAWGVAGVATLLFAVMRKRSE